MPSHSAKSAARDPFFSSILAVLWILLAFFVLYPLLRLFLRAFTTDSGTFSLQPLLKVLGNPDNVHAFGNSLLLAAVVGVGGTLLGFVYALVAGRCGLSPRWTRVIDTINLLPLISPPFTISIAILFSFGSRGLITYDLLGISRYSAYGFTSTAAAEIITYFPVSYLTLRPILAAIDPSMENAAFSMGASRWRVFRSMTLPLAMPGLLNAFLLLFAASLADFATPLILAGNQFPVLPTEAYLQITGQFDLQGGALLAVLLLLPAAVVYFVQRHWLAGRSYVTVGGKATQRSDVEIVAPAVRRLLITLCTCLTAMILYFYLLLLYASLVMAFGANSTFTLANYHTIFTDGREVIVDTLIIAAIATPLGGLYGMLVGYLVARRKFVGRHVLEVTTMLNYALPGTIIGIAYLLAFNDPPVELTGTAFILIACYIFRYSPTGIRATVALLHQIDPSLEEASESLGASSSRTFRRITLPLVMPAFFTGLGVMFIRSMTAISATIFLISISWNLITVRILENMTELALGPAAAFSVLVVVVVYVVLMLVARALASLRTQQGGRIENILGG
ncbi:ABC transporter permease [Candidimonas humi]|uniref:ABC transporter permease n=1 Tax=Candidimonas humi TaxID=683355 RepID=A0ABV8NZS8_9BURK|nr:iron ABC transporter permease [Candidimonas humi]